MEILLLRSSSFDPCLNLALEEALLESPEGPDRALFFYACDPCVVIGRNQNPWVEAAPGSGLPLLRRVSGGGAVYLDRGCLNWSLLVPRGRHDAEAEIAMLARALEELGVRSSSGPRGGLFLGAEGPFRGRKICGTARRMTAGRVLHHGTLLVDADLAGLERSLGGIFVAGSRALASAPSRTANLGQVLPGLGVEGLAAHLAESLAGSGSIRDAEPFIRELAGQDRILSIQERLRGWDWTYGMTPPFSLSFTTPKGGLEVEVLDGLVARLGGPAAPGLGEENTRRLIGSRFDYSFQENVTLLYETPHSAIYS